jgi:hypothetical protein
LPSMAPWPRHHYQHTFRHLNKNLYLNRTWRPASCRHCKAMACCIRRCTGNPTRRSLFGGGTLHTNRTLTCIKICKSNNLSNVTFCGSVVSS